MAAKIEKIIGNLLGKEPTLMFSSRVLLVLASIYNLNSKHVVFHPKKHLNPQCNDLHIRFIFFHHTE